MADINSTLNKLIKLINKSSHTRPELIELYGKLGYLIGASIGGYSENDKPTLQDLKHMYYVNPTLDVALMLQGLTTQTWKKDFEDNPKLSKLGERK